MDALLHSRLHANVRCARARHASHTNEKSRWCSSSSHSLSPDLSPDALSASSCSVQRPPKWASPMPTRLCHPHLQPRRPTRAASLRAFGFHAVFVGMLSSLCDAPDQSCGLFQRRPAASPNISPRSPTAWHEPSRLISLLGTRNPHHPAPSARTSKHQLASTTIIMPFTASAMVVVGWA